MKKRIYKRRKEPQAGFSLLEMLLSVALIASITLVFVKVLEAQAETEHARAVADYMLILDQAVEELVRNIDEFNVIYDQAFQDPSGVVNISVLHNPAPPDGISLELGSNGVLLPMLDTSNQAIDGVGFITADFADRNPMRTDITIAARVADNAGNNFDERALEIIIATRDRRPEKLVREISQYIGGQGGYVSSIVPTTVGACGSVAACQQTVRGAYGDWQVDYNLFNGSQFFLDVFNNPPDLLDGAYLVIYHRATANITAGDYLYRTPQLQNPELNRMYTDLNMGFNSIAGVDNMVIDGTLDVTQFVAAQGSATIQGNLNIGDPTDALDIGQLIVESDMRAADITFDPLAPNPAQQALIEGNFSANALNIAYDAITFDADLRPNINVLGAVSASGIDTLDLQAGEITATTLAGPDINADAVFATDTVVANDMTTNQLNSDQAFATNMTVQGDFTIAILDVGAGGLQIANLTRCLAGCL